MRLMLTGLKELSLLPDRERTEKIGYKWLKVRYCAICKTDAKMWNEGHRDLTLPRVLGHELVAEDDNGNAYVVWPGKKCGTCRYCKSGRENLCEGMKITGFHHDGGFSEYVEINEESLIPLSGSISQHLACFAEPVACALHALEMTRLTGGERVVIFGGGTLGLITAHLVKEMGGHPFIIEKEEKKIDKIRPFLERAHIPCEKSTNESEFDVVINACPAPIAFSIGITKLAKGGRLSFFSGLKKNEHLETNLINLIHYKENEIYGAYGPNRKDMASALPFISKSPEVFEALIEDMILPETAPEVMENVLRGTHLKYILDFTGKECPSSPLQKSEKCAFREDTTGRKILEKNSALCKSIFENLKPVDKNLLPDAQNKIDNKTKPLGALGRLEDLAVSMSLIQQTLSPAIDRKMVIVFAGDHGIAEEGVSAFPSEVTGQMVENFLNGGAAINVLCRHHGIDLQIVDMGVKTDFGNHPDLIHKKVRKGTRNFAVSAAMTEEEAITAIEHGMDVFLKAYEEKPIDIIGLGEMGIANTTSASAIICAACGISPQEATGRGTGVDDKGLSHKSEVIEKALSFHQPNPKSGLDILQKVGGFEIAGIAGAILAAASKGTAVVLDGVISTAAGLIAYLISEAVSGYLISGHKSVEIGQKKALEYMGIMPVIDLSMRLGEGTGAAFTIDIVDAACRIMREMASFDEAGVSNKD